MIQPTFIHLHPNEYSQEFHYYPFAVKLDICVGSCNTLNDLSDKVCIPNETADLLTKEISCECKCKFEKIKCKSS